MIEYFNIYVFIELYDGGLTEEHIFSFKTKDIAEQFINLCDDLGNIESIEGPERVSLEIHDYPYLSYNELQDLLKKMEKEGLFKKDV